MEKQSCLVKNLWQGPRSLVGRVGIFPPSFSESKVTNRTYNFRKKLGALSRVRVVKSWIMRAAKFARNYKIAARVSFKLKT